MSQLMHCFLDQARTEKRLVGAGEKPRRGNHARAARGGDAEHEIEIPREQIAMREAEDMARPETLNEGEQRLRAILASPSRIGGVRKRHRRVDVHRDAARCEVVSEHPHDRLGHAFERQDDELRDRKAPCALTGIKRAANEAL